MPVHVRAKWVPRKRRSLFFGAAYLSYDVRYADGEVQSCVNIDDVLQGARYPADFHTTVSGAKAVAGRGVPGEWVDYPYGRRLPAGNLVSLPEDLSRFAFILSAMGLNELARKYEAVAEKLRTDPSSRTVAEAREWVLGSFGRGRGSLSDRYVYRDGAFDEGLNAEYETLLRRLTDFAHNTGGWTDGLDDADAGCPV
ncbi:hypothetical protein NNX39_13635 [Arthrobacter sp. zg-Y826]|uniref:hypothetical protein n=1 Tax=Arthrobacter jinronghuae TaxID=2964609 RepID=UPI002104B4D2|nr:hypothetical protein [Arthrobacter jinronghuae]MCQ1957539.1 hypothetical protein [Arthrobacter jinronghuae]